MDETANQMSDVRDELVKWFTRDVAHTGRSPAEVADAILARFEVTEKPVVTDRELGVMVADAHCGGVGYFEEQGASLREALAAKGLTIVRREEGTR